MPAPWKLPDGSLTEDADEMAEAWHDLAHPVEALFGCTLSGFDPGLRFNRQGGGLALNLTVDECQKIGRLMEGRT